MSMVSDDPPAMHCVFVNPDSHSVRHGSRNDTIGHIIGPWLRTADERYVTLQGDKDSFIAVKFSNEDTARFALFWDPDNALREELGPGKTQSFLLHRKPKLGMDSRYVRD